MANQNKKPTKAEMRTLIIQGLIDLVVGTLLILIEKLFG